MLAALLAAPDPIPAQDVPGDGWNAPAALELVRRGAERRSAEHRDTTLRSYSARGDGYVYFLLDAADAGGENLVRTDQVAVDLHWRAPDQVRQRIVGMRERRELPIVGLYYYLDRLTIVHDDFGESIVIADGDNVNEVTHPIGASGEEWYDFLLVDSLTLRIPGVDTPVRVHELRVRPRDPGEPAIVGSVFLEAGTGALVRMEFSFTPAAYVDPRLDYVKVTLENGLWEGRYWLPREQRLEIRREMPELDLPFGTIIRTRMRVGDYHFNEPVPDWLFAGRLPISLAPAEERANFAFDRPIDADWELEGVGPTTDFPAIRRAVRTAAREQAMSGLPLGRLSPGSVSEVARYNRAEGAAAGLGVRVRPSSGISGRVYGGWAFGAEIPTAALELSRTGATSFRSELHLNRVADVGRFQAVSGITNSISSLFTGNDWLDPFLASGGTATLSRSMGDGWMVEATGRLEHQRSTQLSASYSVAGEASDWRPVREIDEGRHQSLELVVVRDAAPTGGWWGRAALSGGHLAGEAGSFSFGRAEIAGGNSRTWSARRSRIDITGTAGFAVGTLPRQELALIGGRGSLPGYAFRAFGGSDYAILDVRAATDIAHPWARARLFGAVGWSRVGSAADRSADLFGGSGTRGLKPSIGAGVGLFYDLLHIDVARGLGSDGRTEIIIEFPANFWDFL
jgi:hypothetical protein